MYSRNRSLTRYGRAPEARGQPITIPASTRGIDAASALINMPPDACIYAYNLLPVEYGLRLRKGYREWARGCVENPQRGEAEVRTIIPFTSKQSTNTNDRLFAVTDEGIWDVSRFNTNAPSQMATFSQLGQKAGRGVYTEFTGDAADLPTVNRGHYLYYADGLNGIWVYSEETGLWDRPPAGVGDQDWYYVQPGGSTRIPFPVEDVAFVTVHKQRIWVILENDDDAYYLPIASISGELQRFVFGSKLRHGGDLVGLYNWTVDGGDGVDDYMVAISRGGDVVLYRGEDVEVGPWTTAGAWYIGEVPDSRRSVVEYGPDMFLLSVYGVTSLQSLLRGAEVGVGASNQQPSRFVNRFLRDDVQRGRDDPQWQMVVNPSDGALMIITPTPSATPFIQYSMNLLTGAWGTWQSVPITCAAPWNENFFMGASSTYSRLSGGQSDPLDTPGVVMIYDGSLDGTTIQGVNVFVDSGTAGDAEWSVVAPGEYEASLPSAYDGVSTFTVSGSAQSEVGARYQVTCEIEVTGDAEDVAKVRYRVSYGKVDPLSVPYSTGGGSSIQIYDADTASTDVTLTVETTEPLVNPVTVKILEINVRDAPLLGLPIEFSVLTSFQAYGSHAQFKKVSIARTIGILAGTAAFNVDAIFDYKIEQTVRAPQAVPTPTQNVWDSAFWDQATWDFEAEGQSFPVGALGIGRTIAIGFRGQAPTRINIVGWDCIIQTGGFL